MKSRLAKYSVLLVTVAAIGGGLIFTLVPVANAETNATSTQSSFLRHGWNTLVSLVHNDSITGTVSAISGNSITLAGKNGKTYAVDATNAKILKYSPNAPPKTTTITVSGIQVGDSLRVKGTISGTNITATNIVDGVPGKGIGKGVGVKHGIMGTISAVNGTTLTVTGKDGKTYTVNAIGAQIFVPQATSTQQ